jgi:BASS family bile acid:Na+ symporter
MSAQELLALVIKVSLSSMALAIGLQSTLSELLHLFARPARLLRAVLAVNVVVPVAAVVLVSLFPLIPVVKAGIIVMSVSPAPALLPGTAMKAGGGRGYSYGLYTALVLLGVVIVPATMVILSRFYGVEVGLPPLLVLQRFSTEVLLPLAGGLVVHRLAPKTCERLGPFVDRIATLLLMVAAVPILIALWPHVQALIGNGTVAAMALLAAIALAGGHLLGGPEPERRGALAEAAAMRHPGIALAIAGAAHADKRVTAAVLAVVLVGALVAVPYRLWLRRRGASRPASVSV